MIKKIGYILFLIVVVFTSCNSTKKTVSKKASSSAKSASAEYDAFFAAEQARLKGETKTAKRLFTQFVSVYQNNATAYFNLSKLEYNSFQFDAAQKYAAKAVELDEKNKYFLEHYADVLSVNKLYSKAASIYNKLEQNNPFAAETYIYNQFRIHKKIAKYDEAINDLNRLENLVGVSEEISLEKYELLKKDKKPNKAINEIKKLVADDPSNIAYQSILAEAYEQNDQSDKAAEIYDKLKKKAPNNPNVLLSLSTYYLKQKDTVRYEKVIEEIISNPDVDASFKLSMLLPIISKSTDSAFINGKALPLVEKLRRSTPDNKAINGMYADMLYYAKKYKAASTAYETYLKTEKSIFAPWFNLMLCYSNLDKQDSLISVADQSLEYFPNNALAHYFKATGLYQMQDYARAVKSLQNAADLEPETDLHAQIYSLMGDAYNSMKEYDKSDQSFSKAIKLKEDATTLNNYAYYLSLRNNRLEDALKMSKKSLDLEPGSLTFLDTYGWILYKQGKYQEAKKYIEKAIDPKTGGDPDVLEHLGDIFYKLNKPAKAVEFWKKAADKNGGSELLPKKIKDQKLYE